MPFFSMFRQTPKVFDNRSHGRRIDRDREIGPNPEIDPEKGGAIWVMEVSWLNSLNVKGQYRSHLKLYFERYFFFVLVIFGKYRLKQT